MKTEVKEQIIKLLIVAGYEKELNDIFFIEDFELEFDFDIDSIELI